MTRTVRLFTIGGLWCLALVASASADPIPITSGALTAVRPSLQPAGTASLMGARGFSLEADVITSLGRVDVLTQCQPCSAGSPLSIAGVLSGAAFAGVASMDGHTFTNLSGFDAPTSIFMQFSGIGGLPPVRNGDVTVSLPFTMQGFFTLATTTEVLRGQGMASVLLRPYIMFDDLPQWRAERVRYDFGNASTVPEPSTLILVGGGLLAIARHARARVRRRSRCSVRLQPDRRAR